MQETHFQANPGKLKFKAPYKDLFVRSPAMVEAIAASIKTDGFHLAEPVVCWDGVVIDGHTRVEAARMAGCGNVYGVNINFADEAAALEYAIDRQRNRRNLTDAELVKCILAVDQKAKAGRPSEEKLAQRCANSGAGKSAAVTASVVGKSPRYVEKVRFIQAHAPAEVRAKLNTGGMSIHAAYLATQAARKAEQPPKPDHVDLVVDPTQADYDRYEQQIRAVVTARPISEWPTIARVLRDVAAWLRQQTGEG